MKKTRNFLLYGGAILYLLIWLLGTMNTLLYEWNFPGGETRLYAILEWITDPIKLLFVIFFGMLIAFVFLILFIISAIREKKLPKGFLFWAATVWLFLNFCYAVYLQFFLHSDF